MSENGTSKPIGSARHRGRGGLHLAWLALAIYLCVAVLGGLSLLPDYQLRIDAPYASPSAGVGLWLGTDLFGRSVLYKLLHSATPALALGVLAPALSVPLGVALGALAGYCGKRVDQAVLWLVAVFAALPDVLLVLAIAFVFGKGMFAMVLATSGVSWIGVCRVVRARVLALRACDYVAAASLLGANGREVLQTHILPDVVPLALAIAPLQMVRAIQFEVVLTYLGVGIQNGVSWGTMISDGANELTLGVWWPLASVILAMAGLACALARISDALRDALDPHAVRTLRS